MEDRYQGILIKMRDRREYDALTTFFTSQEGKIVALAKAVKKPAAKLIGGLDLFAFSFIRVVWGRQELPILVDVENFRRFSHIKEDLEKILLACWLTELVDKMFVPFQKSRRAFNLLLSSLALLDSRPPEKLSFLKTFFGLKVLGITGFLPELDRCASCGRALPSLKGNLGFSLLKGGVLCSECRSGDKIALPADALAILRTMKELDINLAGRLRLTSVQKIFLENLVTKFIENIIESPIFTEKTSRYVASGFRKTNIQPRQAPKGKSGRARRP